jgi:hypothetical protein
MGLRSEIRDPEETFSGSRGQKGTGSRIWIRNTGRLILKYFPLQMMETGKGVTYFAQVRHPAVSLCGKGFRKDGTDSAIKTGTDFVAHKFAASSSNTVRYRIRQQQYLKLHFYAILLDFE